MPSSVVAYLFHHIRVPIFYRWIAPFQDKPPPSGQSVSQVPLFSLSILVQCSPCRTWRTLASPTRSNAVCIILPVLEVPTLNCYESPSHRSSSLPHLGAVISHILAGFFGVLSAVVFAVSRRQIVGHYFFLRLHAHSTRLCSLLAGCSPHLKRSYCSRLFRWRAGARRPEDGLSEGFASL